MNDICDQLLAAVGDGRSVAHVRYTMRVAGRVAELLVAEAALDKLGAGSISIHDAEQIPRNAHVIARNPRSRNSGARRLLIGRTARGRYLTLVIERTADLATWLVITGWGSTDTERKLLTG